MQLTRSAKCLPLAGISSYYIDTANKGIAYTSDVSGKYNEDLNLHVYIGCPMYDVERQNEYYKYLCTLQFAKMKKRNQHVIPLGNAWAVKGEGTDRFTVITETQRDAITVAREIAKHNCAELIIHGKDGKIPDRDSYGNDPNPPKR